MPSVGHALIVDLNSSFSEGDQRSFRQQMPAALETSIGRLIQPLLIGFANIAVLISEDARRIPLHVVGTTVGGD